MSIAYINSNSLPCRCWLDGTITSNIIINGTTSFTWLNKIGNTQYDFLQTVSTRFPTFSGKGVTFNSGQRLFPRNLDILNSADSYSIILIAEPLSSSSGQQLLTIGNTSVSFNNFIELKQDNKLMNQLSSPKVLISTIAGESDLIDINLNTQNANVFITSHYTKYGYTEFSNDVSNFNQRVHCTRGYIRSTNPRIFFLGNSESVNTPYLNKINHFLLFSPAISNTHLITLSNLILDSMRNIIWDNITTVQWDIMGLTEWDTII